MINNCKKCKSSNLKIDSNYPYHDIFECLDCKHFFHARIDDCCRKPDEVVTKIQYDWNRIQYVHQCMNCGGANKTKNLNKKTYDNQLRGEFSEDRFGQWKIAKKEESDAIYEGIKYSNYKNTKLYKYHEYLFSDAWKAKRKLVLERDSHICQACKIAVAVDVHHHKYDNLFNEPLEDLQSMCRECHLEFHKSNK
ncbi:MAG: hypothetical protein EOO20_05965 [Chryseobacterium sp.]|nr:MAG: hypothetical protein EOO20_05965 [Chryseobacterium sp.]